MDKLQRSHAREERGNNVLLVKVLRNVVASTEPRGVSADRVHELGRLNLQNISCRGSIRHRGSAEPLVGREEARWRVPEAKTLGSCDVAAAGQTNSH